MTVSRRATLTGSLAMMVAATAFASEALPSQVVITTSGAVEGYQNAQGVNVYKGVRYGEDSYGSRFSKPIAAKFNTGIVPAKEYGSASPQSGDRLRSEDCLFLNIWTSEAKQGAKRPVMVYFHGGAYAAGSGSDPLYDGTNLVSKGDVVVVTVNHRLNAFGYLYLDRIFPGEFPDSGNAGQWDLVLALNWIKNNIAKFGGDTNRIMVFGQSGGGAKIATLMASPSAKGLFQSAATMSGQQVTACGPLNGTARAEKFLSFFKGKMEPDRLRSLPVEALLQALQQSDSVNKARRLYFGPVLDDRMLSRHPFWPDAPRQSKHTPMILGNTKDETRNLIGRKEPETFDLSWDDLPGYLARHMRCDINPDLVMETYRKAYPKYSPSDIFFAASTAERLSRRIRC